MKSQTSHSLEPVNIFDFFLEKTRFEESGSFVRSFQEYPTKYLFYYLGTGRIQPTHLLVNNLKKDFF